MKVISHIKSLREYLSAIRKNDKTLGFVPTMGALHQGHISLVENSVKDNDLTICSIFVNPAQFNNPKDLEKYPRTLERDVKMLEEAGCDIVFAPANSEMYPEEAALTSFSFGYLENILEGKYRPGHFKGVGLIVSKLLHIVQPDRAYFGQKDYQQFLVINKMVSDLNMPVELVRVPIIREEDGLAMSSRNMRLSSKERAIAPVFYESLQAAATSLKNNGRVKDALQVVTQLMEGKDGVSLEYFEIADPNSLQNIPAETVSGQVVLCVAGYVGEIRLIDNLLVEI